MAKSIERVYEYIEKEGLSIREFEKKADIGNGYLSKIKSSNGDLGNKMINKIISAYSDLSYEWLACINDTPMLKKDSKNSTNISKPKKRGIPLVSSEAVAGFGNDVFAINDEDVLANYDVPDFVDVSFMIRVKGDSMAPKFFSGDIIACRTIKNPAYIQWNKAHVIATKEQGILVKRIQESTKEGHYLAVSDNTEYKPFNLPEEDVTGLALVVGVIRLE